MGAEFYITHSSILERQGSEPLCLNIMKSAIRLSCLRLSLLAQLRGCVRQPLTEAQVLVVLPRIPPQSVTFLSKNCSVLKVTGGRRCVYCIRAYLHVLSGINSENDMAVDGIFLQMTKPMWAPFIKTGRSVCVISYRRRVISPFLLSLTVFLSACTNPSDSQSISGNSARLVMHVVILGPFTGYVFGMGVAFDRESCKTFDFIDPYTG